ncbi:hypothetical protein ABIE61_003636 [Marinobacterium sp. MBR-111]|jgi:hypothetical protein
MTPSYWPNKLMFKGLKGPACAGQKQTFDCDKYYLRAWLFKSGRIGKTYHVNTKPDV